MEKSDLIDDVQGETTRKQRLEETEKVGEIPEKRDAPESDSEDHSLRESASDFEDLSSGDPLNGEGIQEESDEEAEDLVEEGPESLGSPRDARGLADSSESEGHEPKNRSHLEDTGSEITEETGSNLEDSVASSLQEELEEEEVDDEGSLEEEEVSIEEEEEEEDNSQDKSVSEELGSDLKNPLQEESTTRKEEVENSEETKSTENLEKKVVSPTAVQERKEEEVASQELDLVDCKPETKEPVQSLRQEPVIPTKDHQQTKEYSREVKDVPKDENKAQPLGSSSRRASSGDGISFQKLKNKFSNGIEENNKKNQANQIEKSPKASNMSDAKNKRFGGTSEKCTQCNRTVYPMEKMEVAGRLLHKTCFKCCKCNSQLSVGRFSIGGKDMYCMTHYKQAFREKGTYDVFTPDNPIKGCPRTTPPLCRDE